MECHYRVLELPLTATADELKKSYRKLALQWHPDKNLENSDEAKSRFQLIQQAYDVLSDPQERAWYDKHRDSILKGGVNGTYKDESLDVFQYFNASCFSGYNDSEKGFYTVYREAFIKIAEEDEAFLDEGERIFPSFGTSEDSYEDIVHRFYSFWQSYCTAKSYVWIGKYDIQEAPNRKVVRLMEKENKKLRDVARRKRNEEIRELVAFVRKRDKRVIAHKKELEEKAAENAKRVQEYRKKMIQERTESLANSTDTEWMSMADLEVNLKVIESQFDTESEDSETIEDSLYCIACDKLFQSEKAKSNHDNSKKHMENLAYLKAVMQTDELNDNPDSGTLIKDEEIPSDESENDATAATKKSKKKKRKSKKDEILVLSEAEEGECGGPILENNTEDIIADQAEILEKKKKLRRKPKAKETVSVVVSSETMEITKDEIFICETCKKDYPTRNKLFGHLKTSGHQQVTDTKNTLATVDHERKAKRKTVKKVLK